MISLVIPCFSSEKTLKPVVAEAIFVLEQRPGIDFEIVLVNDGSTDRTFSAIQELANDTRIKGLDLSRNFGQAAASMAGFAHSVGDIIVYADDDGQSPIDQLWELVDNIQDGVDAAFASFPKRKANLLRAAGSRLNDVTANLLTGKPGHVQLTNFWACRRFLIDQIVQSKTPFPSVGGLLAKSTQNWASVASEQRPRLLGKSTYTVRKLISLWLNGATGFSVLPLRIGALIGLVIGFAGIVFSTAVALRWLFDPVAPPGYTSVFAGMLVLGGINIALVGLVGEYVGRAYMSLNQIPQYVVRGRINFEEI